jgi:hypothetical protein
MSLIAKGDMRNNSIEPIPMLRFSRFRKFWDISLAAIFLTILLVFFTFGLTHAYKNGSDIYNAYFVSDNWPRVKGTIITKTLTQNCGRGQTGYSLDVRYSYQVKGEMYEGNRIWFGNGLCAGIKHVLPTADRFSEGDGVYVYYDENRPFESVLYPGTVENGTLMIFFVLLGFSIVMGRALVGIVMHLKILVPIKKKIETLFKRRFS